MSKPEMTDEQMGNLASEVLHLMMTRTCCPLHARAVLTAALGAMEVLAVVVVETKATAQEAGFSTAIH
jgi:hypothetical protein